MTHRTEMPIVTWIWGESGAGKTRKATEMGKSFYMKDETIWWDNYEQEECIVIDDYSWDGSEDSFRRLLRICDRYKLQGQTKGGYVKINSKYICITCEYPPDHYWHGSKLQQIMRRLANVEHLTIS